MNIIKKTSFALMTGLLLAAGSVRADFYASAALGESFNDGSAFQGNVKTKYKNSTMYTIAGGYELPLPLLDIRGEVELMRTRPETKDGRAKKLNALFLNAYGNIPLIPLIDPYLGMGIGRARYDHANSFAVQGIAGVEYELPFAPVTVGGEYRYLKINETTGKVTAPSKYHTNILMLKARYLF